MELRFLRDTDKREIDFIKLRRLLAKASPWTEAMVEDLIPK